MGASNVSRSMEWTDLPRGAFTGIDWAAGNSTNGFDPYLVWAEADRFAGYGYTPDKPPKWLPLLIELTEGATIEQLVACASAEWLRVPSVYVSSAAPPGLRFCTARVTPTFYDQLRTCPQLASLIRRHELGLPAGAHGDDQEPRELPGPLKPPPLLTGNVIGLIDGGLAFAHANFLRDGNVRTRYFWRQDPAGVGKTPQDLGYGHELTSAEIREVMDRHTYGRLVDETAVYQHFDMGMELNKRLNHGTHVLDVACGPRPVTSRIAGVPTPDAPPSWAPADDEASRCDIVAVQLDWQTVVDTSGGSMTVHTMDALMYILSRCAEETKIAVNLSWGTLAGPHDGSAVLEAAMAQLIALKCGRLRIVLPASNAYQSRTHANTSLVPGQSVTLHWCGQPADKTQNFVEIWLPSEAGKFCVQLTPPGREPLSALAWGSAKMWTADGRRPLCAVIYPDTVAIGDHGTCALIAVAPTSSFDPLVATAPSGVWQITVTRPITAAMDEPPRVPFDAYIERDDEIIGVRTGALQSHFEDGSYDTSGNPGSFMDDPENPTPIRRSGSFNSIGTGAGIDSVGGTRVTGPRWALYSPQKPDPDEGRLPREGVVKVPTTEACSDENAILLGLGAAGSRSGSGGVVRLVGTSDAAPQVTRRIFNGL
ncbi:MAG: subtilase family protein [Ramlibacter sp.]|nr:subtilase family protein [Ramlibacter sp.]